MEGRSECHVAPAEWRLLGWLERERIEYDTYAETQLHFGRLVLDDYKILIISAHPEYWSHEMCEFLPPAPCLSWSFTFPISLSES